MGKMTGAGCVLSCLVGAYVTANPASRLEAVVAAIAGEGLAGLIVASRMGELDGNGSFTTYLLDAICNMTAEQLAAGALVEELLGEPRPCSRGRADTHPPALPSPKGSASAPSPHGPSRAALRRGGHRNREEIRTWHLAAGAGAPRTSVRICAYMP